MPNLPLVPTVSLRRPAAQRPRWASLKHRFHTLSRMRHFLNAPVQAGRLPTMVPFVNGFHGAAAYCTVQSAQPPTGAAIQAFCRKLSFGHGLRCNNRVALRTKEL
jgi:hypothetical protein